MKLLFLTGKFGMGHYSAAFSLAERVSRVNPEADIVIRDIFEYAMPYYSDKVITPLALWSLTAAERIISNIIIWNARDRI